MKDLGPRRDRVTDDDDHDRKNRMLQRNHREFSYSTLDSASRSHGLKSNNELQAYFTKRLEKIVNQLHKNMVGWDEILTPGMPNNIVIQSWRGPGSLAAAAKQGYRGLLSNGYYIDLMWSAARHYAVDEVVIAPIGHCVVHPQATVDGVRRCR